MSFFNKIKELAVKAKCATGFHSGEFTPIVGKPECNLGKTCPDCNEYIKEIQHKYHPWDDYKQSKSCIKERKCKHCEYINKKTIHEGYQQKKIDDRCNVIMSCVRCGDLRKDGKSHSWHKHSGSLGTSCVRCDQKKH